MRSSVESNQVPHPQTGDEGLGQLHPAGPVEHGILLGDRLDAVHGAPMHLGRGPPVANLHGAPYLGTHSRVVGHDEHRGGVGVVDRPDRGEDLVAALAVEFAGRLVGEQHPRPVGHGRGQSDPLLLTSGELGEGAVRALAQAQQGQEFPRALGAFRARHPLTVLIRSGAAAGGLVAAALTLVAVLLLLALTRPARLEMLLRLRTMGAPPRSGRAVGVIETLPGIVLAIVIGLASALIVPRLLASAFNLGPLVGAPPVTLVTPGALLGVIALAGIDLALLALLIDARQAARSDLGQALRRGESA